jgi:hypothetical protein
MSAFRVLPSAALCLAILTSLCGCKSEPDVLKPTGPRPPTTAAQIKIYPKPPNRYELLGTVSVQAGGDVKWDERGNANVGFDRLLADAAKLGANGLLMAADPDPEARLVTAGYHGAFYQLPVRGKPPTAVAQAIYVIKE